MSSFSIRSRLGIPVAGILLASLGSANAAAGWTQTTGIVETITSHNGFVIIATEIEDGACARGNRFYWPISDNDSQVMLSLALSANATGKSIRVVHNPQDPECRWDAAKITHLKITAQ